MRIYDPFQRVEVFMRCDWNCDSCHRTLCTQGNPTLEPTSPEELNQMEEELWKELRFWENALNRAIDEGLDISDSKY